jgi:hypothetical protein
MRDGEVKCQGYVLLRRQRHTAGSEAVQTIPAQIFTEVPIRGM